MVTDSMRYRLTNPEGDREVFMSGTMSASQPPDRELGVNGVKIDEVLRDQIAAVAADAELPFSAVAVQQCGDLSTDVLGVSISGLTALYPNNAARCRNA